MRWSLRNWQRAVRPVGGDRDHGADLGLAVGDDHPVDEQLGQVAATARGRTRRDHRDDTQVAAPGTHRRAAGNPAPAPLDHPLRSRRTRRTPRPHRPCPRPDHPRPPQIRRRYPESRHTGTICLTDREPAPLGPRRHLRRGRLRRTGTGPHVMAAIRNLAISLLRLAGHASIATAIRRNPRDPTRPFRLLTGRK